MITSGSLDILESIPCFASFSPESMRWYLDSVTEQSFTEGKIIMLEGEPCPGLFVMKSGSVKLYRTSLEGGEQIVRIVRSGECFECVPFFDGGPNPVSAQTLERSTAYFITASDFKSLLSTCPETTLQIVPILAMRLRSFLDVIEDFSFRTVYLRLAKLLYQLSEQQDGVLVVSPALALNQQHLACILGCSRQMLNSSLQKFVRAGIIKIKGHRIVILKPEALQELIYPELTKG